MDSFMKCLYFLLALTCAAWLLIPVTQGVDWPDMNLSLIERPDYAQFRKEWAKYEAGQINNIRMFNLCNAARHGETLENPEYLCFIYMARSLLHLERGEIDEAEAYARKSINAGPDLPWGHAAMARVLEAQGRYAKALAVLENMPGLDQLDDFTWIPFKISELRLRATPVDITEIDAASPLVGPSLAEIYAQNILIVRGRISEIRQSKYTRPEAVFIGRNQDREVICSFKDHAQLENHAPGDVITFSAVYDGSYEPRMRLRECEILDAGS